MPVLIILLGGWILLEVMTWQAGLGDYAKSPQRVQLRQGLTSLVGGGRAGLVFIEERFRKKAQIMVRCQDGRHAVNLRPGQVSDEICGVRVELLAILSDGLVNVEVRWGDDASVESTPPSPDPPQSTDSQSPDPTSESPAAPAAGGDGEGS
ncbi:MAG: hypothetical protein AAFY88_15790 [Acidobacteriota bacterium]